MRVDMKEKLKVHVPLHFVGEEIAPGAKQGGVVTHDLVDIEVQCLPKDLPEFIEVDVSALEIGESLHLSDIKLPKGLDIVALSQGEDHDLQVVAIQANRATLAEDDAGEAEGEASDGAEEESGE